MAPGRRAAGKPDELNRGRLDAGSETSSKPEEIRLLADALRRLP